MVLYNVTINIDEDVEQDWLEWMKAEHIPEVMSAGGFSEHRLLRMLSEAPDETGSTYAIQYLGNSLSELEEYLANDAPRLQKKSIIRYGTKMAAFQTVLEEV